MQKLNRIKTGSNAEPTESESQSKLYHVLLSALMVGLTWGSLTSATDSCAAYNVSCAIGLSAKFGAAAGWLFVALLVFHLSRYLSRKLGANSPTE